MPQEVGFHQEGKGLEGSFIIPIGKKKIKINKKVALLILAGLVALALFFFLPKPKEAKEDKEETDKETGNPQSGFPSGSENSEVVTENMNKDQGGLTPLGEDGIDPYKDQLQSIPGSIDRNAESGSLPEIGGLGGGGGDMGGMESGGMGGSGGFSSPAPYQPDTPYQDRSEPTFSLLPPSAPVRPNEYLRRDAPIRRNQPGAIVAERRDTGGTLQRALNRINSKGQSRTTHASSSNEPNIRTAVKVNSRESSRSEKRQTDAPTSLGRGGANIGSGTNQRRRTGGNPLSRISDSIRRNQNNSLGRGRANVGSGRNPVVSGGHNSSGLGGTRSNRPSLGTGRARVGGSPTNRLRVTGGSNVGLGGTFGGSTRRNRRK